MASPGPASAAGRGSPSSSSPFRDGSEGRLPPMKIKTVGVLGAGLMGSGIAEVAAKAGYTTIVREVSEELSRKGRARIEASLARAVEKGKLDGAARDAAKARLSETTHLEDLADCDIVIEAIVENLETKNVTFAALDRAC